MTEKKLHIDSMLSELQSTQLQKWLEHDLVFQLYFSKMEEAHSEPTK